MKRRIILLGPPGSGKGTIAALLQQKFGIQQVSSGHLLRKDASSGSPLGNRINSFLQMGELVPDEMVLDLIGMWIKSAPLESGFVLDGFPRTLPQASALDQWLAARSAPVEVVLLYDCDAEVILERVTGRLGCPRCGRVYHLRSLPPRAAGRCDDCNLPLLQRADDREEVVRKRLEIYSRRTEPLVDYYRRQGKLTVVDATQSPQERFAETVAALN